MVNALACRCNFNLLRWLLIGSFFGAYLGGLFHDLYGSYDYAWYLAIALSVFAAIIHLPIKEEPVLRLKTE